MTEANEMGKLPEGWRMVRLGVVLFVINQKNKQVKTTEYQNIGLYPIVDQSEKKISGFYDNIKKVITADLPIVIFGDHTRIVKYIDFPFIPGADGTQILKPLEKADIIFFYYLIVKASEQIGNHGYDRHLKYLKEHYILFPTSLSEQHKIAEILETVDNAIEKTGKTIEKYKRIKQGLMQDLLTRGVVENDELGVMNYELRDEKKHGFKDSTLGRIPEEWEVVELQNKDIIKLITDGSHFSPQPVENGEYYIATIENISDNKIDMPSCKKISRKDYENLKKNNCEPQTNDVLFTKDGTIGVVIKHIQKENLVVLSSIAIIRSKQESLLSNYLVQYLKSNHIWKQLETLSGGSALKRIVLRDIKGLLILLPPLSEQHIIASILSQTDETIEKEQKYKQKLESIKQGLMVDLLTGNVRVNHLIKQGEKNVQTA